MLALILLSSCTKDTQDSDTQATCEPQDFAGTAPDDLALSELPGGDLSCLDAWLPACPTSTADTQTEIKVRDWAGGEPLAGSALIDGSWRPLSSGKLSLSVPACTPLPLSLRDDLEFVNVYPSPVPELGELRLRYVTQATNATNHGQAGMAIRSGAAAIYGEVQDCSGDTMAGVAVVLVEGAKSFYGTDSKPNLSASATDRSGEFFLLDARAGSATVEAWASDGAGGYALVARSRLRAEGDQITHVTLRAGAADGYGLPESCL